jgi:hypothetical protein
MELQKVESKEIAHILDGMIEHEAPIDAKDYLIPSLLLMQSTSELVKQELARTGEVRDSVSHNKIMEKGKKLEFIPFSVHKTWISLTAKGNKFLRQVPYTVENCGWPREQIIDGVEVVNYETLNYYVLLPEEVKTGMFVPYILSFRSTNYRAGKTLETARAKLQEFKKPLAYKTFELSAVPQENDKGSWFAYRVAEARNSTAEELMAVKKWYDIVKSGRTKVDESALKREAAETGVAEDAEF